MLISTDGEQTPVVETAAANLTPGSGVTTLLAREGTGEPLFLVPGLEGDPDEMAPLVTALTGPQPVYVLTPHLLDAAGRPITTVERIAELMVSAARQVSPTGPHRLAGYSFGALVALDMARQLRAAGEGVENLFLVEGVYDERYWPRGIWLRALIRRTRRQLTHILRMRPTAAIAEFRLRAGRLVQRMVRRNSAGADPLHGAQSDAATTMSSRAYAAISQYAPPVYDAAMTLIASSQDRHFGCDTTKIWAGRARHLDIERIDGDHLTVMHDPTSAAAVAAVIDHRLALNTPGWPGLRPVPGFERPLIVTTMRWFSAARLAHALAESGFEVSACRPASHPLELVDTLVTDSRLRKLWPLRSLTKAIDRANPDLIMCDDERALALLRRLHVRVQQSDPELAAVIARSLGHVGEWSSITSRAGLAAAARALDLPAPDTTKVASLDEVHAWIAAHELPFALKTDGSWGGRGVAIVDDPARLPRIWHTISNPPGIARGLKRAVFDRDTGALVARFRDVHPQVNAQQFCAGTDAIVTAACVDGKVLSLVCIEVAQASEARGPAAVVRIIEHAGMADAASALISRFGLSGFCGFDFVLADDGTAHLVELNPRVTPTCHLLVEGGYQTNRLVALFPFEMLRERAVGPQSIAVLDLPVRAPLLIAHGTKLVAARHRVTSRVFRQVQRAGARRL